MYKHEFDEVEYKKMADWCNENECTIEDKDEYYEIVKVDVTEFEKQITLQNLQHEINSINIKLSELKGIYVSGNNEYDVFVDGELVIMDETEFQNYSDELSNKRRELLQRYKELK